MTEKEAFASDSDKSVDGEDTAAGEWITMSTVHSVQSTCAYTYIPNRVRGVKYCMLMAHVHVHGQTFNCTRVADLA